MNRGRAGAPALGIVLALVFAGCSSNGSALLGSSPRPSVPNPAQLLPTGTASPRASTGSTTGSSSSSTGSGKGAKINPETASPSPMELPWESTVYVDAVISPACVLRGGLATITVSTVSQAAIAYHAIYAGTHGGAPPPYGSGYGGNDKGFADKQGRWKNSWTVRADAPPGPARADVVVSDGRAWGYDDPPFWVADASGHCK